MYPLVAPAEQYIPQTSSFFCLLYDISVDCPLIEKYGRIINYNQQIYVLYLLFKV